MMDNFRMPNINKMGQAVQALPRLRYVQAPVQTETQNSKNHFSC
jgi:hypothetical protein